MINIFEVNETNKMIEQENLRMRVPLPWESAFWIVLTVILRCSMKKYTTRLQPAPETLASNTGDKISMEYGIPIVNKRISVTPIALVGGAACKTSEDFVSLQRRWTARQRRLV